MLDNTTHEHPAIVIELNKEGTRQVVIPLEWAFEAIAVIVGFIAFALIFCLCLYAIGANPIVSENLRTLLNCNTLSM